MSNESEKARWAKLAGLPKKETKQQLDENVVGIGAVNQIFPTREPNDYEMAFEHFLGEMYDSKKDKVEEEEMSDAEKEKVDREVDAVRDDLDQISKLAKDAGEDAEDIKDMVDEDLNENQSTEIEAFLKSKGYKIEKVDGSMEANEREGEFASKMEKDPNIVKQKNSKAFISPGDLIHDGVKSFMVFIPSLSPESKDNASLKNEIIKKFGAVDPSTGTFFTSLIIPVEKKSLEETGFGKGSSDGTEGFGDMLYKGMDEMYKKHGKDMVDEILEMYKKSETK